MTTEQPMGFPSGLRLLISGATGFVGSALTRAALAAGCEVCIITRSSAKASRLFGPSIRTIQSADALDANERFDGIVHLAGANVFALPWFGARKRVLMASRLGIADSLLRFCERAKHRPRCWIQASAVGIYPTTAAAPIDESNAPGEGFAPELCLAIEQRVAQAQALGVRGVSLRLGLILGRQGGVFPTLRLSCLCAGGVTVGSGEQRVAWVHVNDVIAVIAAALPAESTLQGAVNVVAPHAPNYREFIGAIARAAHRPSIFRIPAPLMRVALGERSPLLLEGAEIRPQALLDQGFHFRYAKLEDALVELCLR